MDVTLGENITATFSEEVLGADATSVTLATELGTAVPGVVTYDAATRTGTLDPTANLAVGIRYTVRLSNGITDATGNKVSAATWNFNTDARPTMTGWTPARNSTNVDRDGNIKVTFSEAVTGVNGSSVKLVTSGGSTVSAVVSYKASTRTATLNPKSRLKANSRYTVTLSSGIKDAAGNTLTATTWNFRTGAR